MRWLLALCLVVSGVCDARPFTIDDLTALESYGQVKIASRYGVVLVERRRAYDTANDYGYDYFTRRLLSRIMAAQIDPPSAPVPLFPQEDRAGYWMGDFSPDGHQLIVFRLVDRRLSLGVVDLGTRNVRWSDVSPDLPIMSPSPSWLDNDHLLVVATAEPRLPEILSLGNRQQDDLRTLWARAAKGRSASSTTASSREPAQPEAAVRQLIRLNIRTGQHEVLFRGNIVDASASPDARYAAIVTAEAPRRPPSTILDTAYVARRHRLTLLDLRSEATSRLAEDILPGLLRWSPDGQQVLAFAPSEDLHCGEFVIASIDGGIRAVGSRFAPAVAIDQSAIVVHAAFLGSVPIALMRVGGTPRWVRLDTSALLAALPAGARLVGSSRDRLWFAADDRLLAIDANMHAIVLARRLIDAGIQSLDPASIGMRDLLNPATPLAAWRKTRGENDVVVKQAGAGIAVMPGSDMLLATGHDVAVTLGIDEHGIGRLSLTGNEGATIVDRINQRLAGVTLPVARRVDAAGRHHWLFLPPAAQRAPLVMIPYPGQQFGSAPPLAINPSSGDVPTNIHLLTAAGFAVLMPSLPPIGPGGEYRPLLDASEAAVDAAIATGGVDPDRLAVLGHSFGGYAAMMLATHSLRYKAIIASSGPYDLAAAHVGLSGPDRIALARGIPFSSSAGWAEGGQAHMGAAPTRNMSAYIGASPIWAADRVTAPVILVHGDGDIVGVDQAEHMFMELARHDKDATLVRYWGEGHVLSSPANIRDYWEKVISFLHQHLEPATSRPAAKPHS